MNKVRVGITHGDINGVGYEVILKTFENEEMLDLCTPVLYGSPRAAIYYKKLIESPTNFTMERSAEKLDHKMLNMVNCFGDEELKIDMGISTPEAGTAAFVSLERAMSEYEKGLFDVLVTAPINKHSIQNDKFNFNGQTEYVASKMKGDEKPLMILMHDSLRVALVTTHLPIAKVASALSKELIKEKIVTLDKSLKRDLNVENPRIAVLGLNPHCGDNGLIGDEEERMIKPAVDECFAEGVKCVGPYPADGFFGSGMYKQFDAILAMYHDQGLAPFKALAHGDGVNFTAGLSIVRTSPAHGTGYDVVGRNEASEDSFRHAVFAAIDIYRNRKSYDEARSHPLEKHYFEKRDDSDKLKLQQESE